jgi:RNA polymerase sigma-70 factor (ECF subfamily)
MEPDTDQLIYQIAKHKPEALEKVMDLYFSNVYYVAKSILYHVAAEEDIEECVQDSFLDAWNNINKYNPERGTFKTWLLILCKYRALNLRKTLLSKPEVIEFEEFQSIINENPESEYLWKEGSQEIISAINTLGPIDREIFIRRFILEQSINEISKIMKLSRKAIDNRLWRGRIQLKDTLSSLGGEKIDE